MASDLLKPDPIIPPQDEEGHGEDEEDLEALRMAALQSIKPKKKQPAFQLRTHPQRSNLLAIVPLEDTPPPAPKQQQQPYWQRGPPPVVVQQGPPVGEQKKSTDKFSRFDRESESEESEYSEYSEIVSETDDEDVVEEEKAGPSAEASVAKEEDETPTPKATPAEEADDVLNVDCTDEVDEFSSLLKEFEEELLTPQQQKLKEQQQQKKKNGVAAESGKKRKHVRVVKKRKKTKISDTSLDTTQSSVLTTTSFTATAAPPAQEIVGGRRSPNADFNAYNRRDYRRSPPSPHYRYRSPPPRSPPRFRDRSPAMVGGRGGGGARAYSPMRDGSRRRSPYDGFRRSRSPPPYRIPGGGRYRSPSPYRQSVRRSPPPLYPPFPPPPLPPPRRRESPSVGRREGSPRLFRDAPGRGGSAPRYPDQKRHGSSEKLKEVEVGDDGKSRSLPPRRHNKPEQSSSSSASDRKLPREEDEYEARIRKLPTPEREKLLARRNKFSRQDVKPEKKVISLKASQSSASEAVVAEKPSKINRLISEEVGDAISLSVDDTLDMFEESGKSLKKGKATMELRTKLSTKKAEPTSGLGRAVEPAVDLRVQLHRKRQQQQLKEDIPHDSLEKATLDYSNDNSGEEEEEEGYVAQKKSATKKDASKRLVKRPSTSHSEGERRILVASRKASQDSLQRNLEISSPTKRRSVMERLGEPVHNTISEIVAVPKRKVVSSSSRSPSKVAKKEKKKEKKEKKKEKKEKKKKNKEKSSKSRKHRRHESQSGDSLEEGEAEEGEAQGDEVEDNEAKSSASVQPVFDKEEEELLSFFEADEKGFSLVQNDVGDQPSQEDVMLRMKKLSRARMKRLKEIEEDKRKHK